MSPGAGQTPLVRQAGTCARHIFSLESVGGLTTYLLLTTAEPYSTIRDQVREKLESHTSRAVVHWYANSLRKAAE